MPGWIADHAAPLHTTDAAAPLDDLEALRRGGAARRDTIARTVLAQAER